MEKQVKLHSFRVGNKWNYTRFKWKTSETTIASSGEQMKLHSFPVGNKWNYTRSEWGTSETSLASSGEDVPNFVPYGQRLAVVDQRNMSCIRSSHFTQSAGGKLHSKRVEKMQNYTRNEWRRCKTTLETSEKIINYTQNECILNITVSFFKW